MRIQDLETSTVSDVESLVESFLFAQEAATLTPRTIETYSCQLQKLVRFLTRERVKRITAVTPDHVRGFQLFLRKDLNLSPIVQKTTSTCVRTFLKWCVREHLLDHDPCTNVLKPRVPKVIQKPLTEKQVRAILGDLEGRKHGLQVSFLTCSSVRTQVLQMSGFETRLSFCTIVQVSIRFRMENPVRKGAAAQKNPGWLWSPPRPPGELDAWSGVFTSVESRTTYQVSVAWQPTLKLPHPTRSATLAQARASAAAECPNRPACLQSDRN